MFFTRDFQNLTTNFSKLSDSVSKGALLFSPYYVPFYTKTTTFKNKKFEFRKSKLVCWNGSQGAVIKKKKKRQFGDRRMRYKDEEIKFFSDFGFGELGVNEEIINVLKNELGIERPSYIQVSWSLMV